MAFVARTDWFAEQTEGRIQQLLPEGALGTDTRLVLANAIWFTAHRAP